MQGGLEDILTWLKDTRKFLSGGLPTAYEELQSVNSYT